MGENWIRTDDKYPAECGSYWVQDYKTGNGKVTLLNQVQAFFVPILEDYVPGTFAGMRIPGFFTRDHLTGKCEIIEPIAWRTINESI